MDASFYHIKSTQTAPHKACERLMARYASTTYHRSPSTQQKLAFLQLKAWVEQEEKWLIDWGCGTGESTHHLAQSHPDTLCIGIDKSQYRLQRAQYKQKNLHYLQANAIDLLILIGEENTLRPPSQQFFLYPNPWPKAKHKQRRFHLHPIFPSILSLSPIQMRTNWLIYAQEWQQCAQILKPKGKTNLEQLNIETPITAFERKYHKAGLPCYQVTIT